MSANVGGALRASAGRAASASASASVSHRAYGNPISRMPAVLSLLFIADVLTMLSVCLIRR